MQNTRQQGSQWEKAAETFLHRQGLKSLRRNYHGRIGEIDLIMLDGETLVFIEVRYRSNNRFGSGADSVTRIKQGRSIAAARIFLEFGLLFRRGTLRALG